MSEGLALFGDNESGDAGVFGPVISRLVEGDEGLQVWDAVTTLARTAGFWELKRTRTAEPRFGKRATT